MSLSGASSKKQKESSLILRKAKFQAIFEFVLSSASGGAGGGKYNRISAFVSMPVLLIRSSLEKFFKKNFRDDSFSLLASPKDSLHRHPERSEGSIKTETVIIGRGCEPIISAESLYCHAQPRSGISAESKRDPRLIATQSPRMTEKALSFLRLRGASGAQGISAPASCRKAHKRRFLNSK